MAGTVRIMNGKRKDNINGYAKTYSEHTLRDPKPSKDMAVKNTDTHHQHHLLVPKVETEVITAVCSQSEPYTKQPEYFDISEDSADQEHHASLADRVQELERFMGDSAAKHTAELETLKQAHNKHAKDFDCLSGINDQQDCEWEVVTSPAVNVRKTTNIRGKVDGEVLGCKMTGARVRGHRVADSWLALADEPGFIKINLEGDVLIQKVTAPCHDHHASIAERVAELERFTGDSGSFNVFVDEVLLKYHHDIGDLTIDVDMIKDHIYRISGMHRSEFRRKWGDYMVPPGGYLAAAAQRL
jgi:hypothetical protein